MGSLLWSEIILYTAVFAPKKAKVTSGDVWGQAAKEDSEINFRTKRNKVTFNHEEK